MKRILFFFLSLLPYLASAQVAKDTVTVLTIADIPADAIRDTTNFTFVQDNGFKKATFDSLAKYTRVKLQTYTLDSTHIAANGLNLQGTRFTGVLPTTRGGTGAGTQFTAGSVVFAGTSGVYAENSNNFTYDNSSTELSLGVNNTSVSSTGNRLRLHNAGINFTSANVNHGMTVLAPTNAYFVGRFGSESNGGAFFRGLSDANTWGLAFEGVLTTGNSSFAAVNFRGAKKLDTTYQALAGTEIVINFENLSTSLMRFLANGNTGIGVTSPTATLHLRAGTNTTGGAPLKFSSGVSIGSAEAGAMEYDGSNLFFTPTANNRRTVNVGITASASLNFGFTNAQSNSDLTVSVPGAALGDVVSLGIPNASMPGNSFYSAWVSAADVVTVRFNNYSANALDPSSGTFKIFVTKI